VTKAASSKELATTEWVLLRDIYHYVLTRSPSPEAAQLSIASARKNSQLRLRAWLHEHRARPGLMFSPGERPPPLAPKCTPDHAILSDDRFSEWDWERSHAFRRDADTKSLFEYIDIVGNRDDVLKLWPAEEGAINPIPGEALTKPSDVPELVWAIVLVLDELEKQSSAKVIGATQQQLAEKVGEQLKRRVSVRTLQKALKLRRARTELV
jgi:hypothetical protein